MRARLLLAQNGNRVLILGICIGDQAIAPQKAGLAAFLASDDSDYITGSTFFVDGGLLWNYQEQ